MRTGTQAASSVYTYDLRNRMTKVVTGGVETDDSYDTSGVLVSESGQSAGAYYLNDSSNPTGYTKAIELKTGTSPSTATISRSYVLGMKVERLTDGHGGTRALISANGQQLEQYDYDAFGTLIRGTHADPVTHVVNTITVDLTATPWLFGGDGFFGPSTGWTYHLARWTNGFWFTQSDFGKYGSDSDPISLHKYLYASQPF